MEREQHKILALILLQKGNSLTRNGFAQLTGSYCLNSRIADLRKLGYEIFTDMVRNQNNSGSHAVYYMRDSDRYRRNLLKTITG